MPELTEKEKNELFHKRATEKNARCETAKKHFTALREKHGDILDVLETHPGEFDGALGNIVLAAIDSGAKFSLPGKKVAVKK